jgi:quercetin dioxygenase-like cupin family protein
MLMNTATHHVWNDVPLEELSDTIRRRVITGDRMMIAHVYLKEGAVVPMHQHENEQITYILEGALRFRIQDGADGGERGVTVKAGQVLHIPSNVPHEATALEDTLDVDVFSPPRADWLDQSDAYLRDAPVGSE